MKITKSYALPLCYENFINAMPYLDVAKIIKLCELQILYSKYLTI